MLDILRQHLAQSSTAEMLAMVEAAHHTFERIELQNYEQGFEELLLIDEAEVSGGADLNVSILELTCELLRQILREHGVVCTPEAPCQVLTDLVNALLDLPSYSDTATLQATARFDGEASEAFAEVVALLTEYAPEDLMVHLESVDFYLIKRIREISQRELSEEELERQSQRSRQYAQKLARGVRSTVLSEQLETLAAIRQGLPLGMPFSVYIQRFGHQLQQWTSERSAQELLAMAFASRDGLNNPRGVVEECLPKYVPISDRVVDIEVHLGDKLLRLEQYREQA